MTRPPQKGMLFQPALTMFYERSFHVQLNECTFIVEACGLDALFSSLSTQIRIIIMFQTVLLSQSPATTPLQLYHIKIVAYFRTAKTWMHNRTHSTICIRIQSFNMFPAKFSTLDCEHRYSETYTSNFCGICAALHKNYHPPYCRQLSIKLLRLVHFSSYFVLEFLLFLRIFTQFECFSVRYDDADVRQCENWQNQIGKYGRKNREKIALHIVLYVLNYPA